MCTIARPIVFEVKVNRQSINSVSAARILIKVHFCFYLKLLRTMSYDEGLTGQGCGQNRERTAQKDKWGTSHRHDTLTLVCDDGLPRHPTRDGRARDMWRWLLMALFAAAPASGARADEDAFLKSLDGNWAGGGMVRIRTNLSPVNVSCNFNSEANGLALSMEGVCRGMLIISRNIDAQLRYSGSTYSGSYLGPRGGRAGLNGSRRGDAINLTIRWAKEVNGDRSADLILRKIGANGMQLTTMDVDPASGKRVVTSEINLKRR